MNRLRVGPTGGIEGAVRVKRRHLLAASAFAALGAGPPVRAAESRRIGFLVTGARPAQGEAPAVEGVRAALRASGPAEGAALQTEVRYGDTPEALERAAAELVALEVAVIVTVLTPAAIAARRATDRIPIVMAGAADPVATGLVASLARPGGNVTGVAAQGPELAAKNLELARQWWPSSRRVAVLASAGDPYTPLFVAGLERAGAALGFELVVTRVAGAGEYESAFAAWLRPRVDAVFVQPSLAFAPAVALARQHRLASFSFVRAYAVAGGLYAYATDTQEVYPLAADYVKRVLAGTRAGELPVVLPTRFVLTLNTGAAQAIGQAVPRAVRLRATEVID